MLAELEFLVAQIQKGHTEVLECLRDLVAKRLGEASRG